MCLFRLCVVFTCLIVCVFVYESVYYYTWFSSTDIKAAVLAEARARVDSTRDRLFTAAADALRNVDVNNAT